VVTSTNLVEVVSISDISISFSEILEEKNSLLECICIKYDLTDTGNLENIVENCDVDLVVNCAGFGKITDFLKLSDKEDLDTVNVNFVSPLILTKKFSEKFLQKGKGIILNVCSTGALYQHPYMAVYSSAKSALLHYSLALDEELSHKNKNVRVLFKLKNDEAIMPFDAEYKKVINKIDLLTQFVKKLNPNIDFRKLYSESEQLGDYVIELRNLLVKNIRFRMAKDGLDKTKFNNDYVENLFRATESILFMMQSDISDNDEELMSTSNKEFVKVLDKYTNILSNLYDINFRTVCKIYNYSNIFNFICQFSILNVCSNLFKIELLKII